MARSIFVMLCLLGLSFGRSSEQEEYIRRDGMSLRRKAGSSRKSKSQRQGTREARTHARFEAEDDDAVLALFFRTIHFPSSMDTSSPTTPELTSPPPTPSPTQSTEEPTDVPSSPEPTAEPVPEPMDLPTAAPTPPPTSYRPTPVPQAAPTPRPSPQPITSPPTPAPQVATAQPITSVPTRSPVAVEPALPTGVPTLAPQVATTQPTLAPQMVTLQPITSDPTLAPQVAPTPLFPPTLAPATLSPTGGPMSPPTQNPTKVPTTAPTMAPTQRCNQDEALRALLIRVIINAVSDSSDVGTEGTPQNMAMNWIINQDTRFLCPNDPTLKRRYSLACFYFSTRGSSWSECSAPEDFSDPESIAAANAACNIMPFPESGSDAWLTPSDECQWGGVFCDESNNIQLLDVGTFLPCSFPDSFVLLLTKL